MTETPSVSVQTCAALNRKGLPCGAIPGPGGQFCVMHDPDPARRATKKAIQAAGGAARHTIAPAAPCDLSTPEARRRALEETVNRLRAGHESATVSRTVLYAVQVAAQLAEQAEL